MAKFQSNARLLEEERAEAIAESEKNPPAKQLTLHSWDDEHAPQVATSNSTLPAWLQSPPALKAIGALFALCMIYNLYQFARPRHTPSPNKVVSSAKPEASQTFQFQYIQAAAAALALQNVLSWARPPAKAIVNTEQNSLIIEGSNATLAQVAQALVILDEPIQEKDPNRQGEQLFVKLNHYYHAHRPGEKTKQTIEWPADLP